MESNRHLRRIRDQQKIHMTLYESLRQQGVIGPKAKKHGTDAGHRIGLVGVDSSRRQAGRYQFEEAGPEQADDVSDAGDGQLLDYVLAADVTVGQIMFGDVDNLNSTTDLTHYSQDESLSEAEHIVRAERDLMLAWSLGASHVGIWTADHEDLFHNIAHNTVRLFTILLHCSPQVLSDIDTIQATHGAQGPMLKDKKKDKGQQKHTGLHKVLRLLKSLLHLLHLDTGQRHLMVCGLSFVHSTLDLLVRNKDLQKHQCRLHTLHGCYLLLKYCDTVLATIYSNTAKLQHHTGIYTQLG